MDITEIQSALSCFGAGAPDGIIGIKTANAVHALHHHLIKDGDASGQVTENTIDYLNNMQDSLPTDKELACKCGSCDGFGKERYIGKYRTDKPRIEAYYEYEYKGISLMTRWTVAFIRVMHPKYNWKVTSGYRCHNDNLQHGRTSTNHMGKAIDIAPRGLSYNESRGVCSTVRIDMLMLGSQIGWHERNKIALEPTSLAPNWIHVDCRTYARTYIEKSITGAL